MKKRLIAAAFLGTLLLHGGPASAQVSAGPTLAFHNDFDFGIGALVEVAVPQLHEDVGFVGDLTFFFPDPDGLDVWEANGILTWDLPLETTSVSVFGLGGLHLARLSYEADIGFGSADGSDIELGLNLGGGVRFQAAGFRPLVGLRAELSGAEGFAIFAALPFQLTD